jgi:predicted nucleic acid-binding protein
VDRLTAYDAAYLALAEALDAVLLTRDRRLASAAGTRTKVVLV